MRARLALAAVVLLVVGAACSTAEPNAGSNDPDRPTTVASSAPNAPNAPNAPRDGSGGVRQDATVVGRIVGRDGQPLPGMPVTVVRDDDSRGIDAALTAIFSLGIACVATPESCDGSDQVVDSATTDGDGRYELTLPDAYLPGYETNADWVVAVGRAPAAGESTGPSSSFELEVNTKVQEAPDLALWDATPTLAPPAGGLIGVDIPRLSGGPELEDLFARFVDDGGDVVWGITGKTVDPRVIEDRPTRVVSSGSADVTVRHRDGRTIYHQQVATATVPYAGVLVPLSRAKPCSSDDGALVGCPFTDGDLTRTSERLGGVTVDLGAATEVGLVVVRGEVRGLDDDEVDVSGSVDGTTWTALRHRRLDGTNGWSASAAGGSGTPSFRFVRVTNGSSGFDLAEVSVWAPTDVERAAASAPRSSAGGGTGDTDRALPMALAVVLVVAVGVGLLVVRRRRAR